jgi:hypothetical protein
MRFRLSRADIARSRTVLSVNRTRAGFVLVLDDCFARQRKKYGALDALKSQVMGLIAGGSHVPSTIEGGFSLGQYAPLSKKRSKPQFRGGLAHRSRFSIRLTGAFSHSSVSAKATKKRSTGRRLRLNSPRETNVAVLTIKHGWERHPEEPLTIVTFYPPGLQEGHGTKQSLIAAVNPTGKILRAEATQIGLRGDPD